MKGAAMKKMRGVTLVELMVTLTIFAGVLTLGIVSLRGYYPKQQLLASAQNLENSLNRGQSEASSRSLWTCVKLSATGVEVWVDKDGDHETAGSAGCGNSGDLQIGSTLEWRGKTSFVAGCSSITDVLWFNTASQPQLCPGSSVACTNNDIQLILSNSALASGGKAREIEVGAGGMISIVKPGSKGMFTNRWAKFGSEGGAGACE